MEDWLQEFDPLVQSALGRASQLVAQRGGDALSVEDLLLVLLERRYPLSGFLRGRGVDLDELIRAIQCEQSIVSVPSEQDGLSRDLIAWLARVRDCSAGIRGIPELMGTLVHHCDWLSQRAYIAVLEQVSEEQWEALSQGNGSREGPAVGGALLAPLESDAWPASEEGMGQARRLASLAASSPSPLLQMLTRSRIQAAGIVAYAASAYTDCFGQSVAVWRVPVASITRQGMRVSDAMWQASAGSGETLNWFFLDGTSPELLAAVIEREGIRPWAELTADPSMALVIAHPPDGENSRVTARLCAQLDLFWSVFSQPRVAGIDVLRYCQKHQPRLEAIIGMPIETGALRLAVATSTGRDPGVVAEHDAWLEDEADYERSEALLRSAGAMVQSELALGPVRLSALEARERMDEQLELLGLARGDASAGALMSEEASLEKVATEVEWLEQVREGTPVLDKAAVLRWLENRDSPSSSSVGFWYDAPCASVVTRE